jgi:hypothetical protein
MYGGTTVDDFKNEIKKDYKNLRFATLAHVLKNSNIETYINEYKEKYTGEQQIEIIYFVKDMIDQNDTKAQAYFNYILQRFVDIDSGKLHLSLSEMPEERGFPQQ